MSIKQYSRLELAENQLETAIGLLVSGEDKFSVITLAGAADVILCRLVTNTGQENFTEYSLKMTSSEQKPNSTKETHGREINDTLFINDLKHMDKDEDGYITLNVFDCALAAIAKALANYVKLVGRDKYIVQAFMAWGRLNLDPKKYNIYSDPNWKPTT